MSDNEQKKHAADEVNQEVIVITDTDDEKPTETVCIIYNLILSNMSQFIFTCLTFIIIVIKIFQCLD